MREELPGKGGGQRKPVAVDADARGCNGTSTRTSTTTGARRGITPSVVALVVGTVGLRLLVESSTLTTSSSVSSKNGATSEAASQHTRSTVWSVSRNSAKGRWGDQPIELLPANHACACYTDFIEKDIRFVGQGRPAVACSEVIFVRLRSGLRPSVRPNPGSYRWRHG